MEDCNDGNDGNDGNDDNDGNDGDAAITHWPCIDEMDPIDRIDNDIIAIVAVLFL